MNRNRHAQYRRSIYRKRRIRVIIITVFVVLALLAALFLILGNILFDKTNDGGENAEKTSAQTQKDDSLPADSIRQIKAAAISLDGGLNAVSSALDSAKAGGFDAVSVKMNGKDGKLTHYSNIADRLKYSSFNDVKVSAEELAKRAKTRSLYVSGVYYVSAFSEDDDLARSIAIAELATVISESLRAGIDEVILTASDISEKQCAEITHLISEIRAFVPEAVIGFALPDALVKAEKADLIDSLANEVSFLALDLTGYGDNDPAEFAQDLVSTELYSLLRYKMRVMIPFLEESEKQNSVISAVESSGISNWQIVK